MKSNYFKILLLVIIGLYSCSNDKDSIPDPIISGEIVGSVNLYDELNEKVIRSSMTIKLEGSSPLISTTTDFNGQFSFSEVLFGTYTIVYEKPGFGTFKKFDVEHIDQEPFTVVNNVSLSEISQTKITKIEANPDGNAIVLSITTTPAGSSNSNRYIRFFLSNFSSVSNENYTYASPGLIAQKNPQEVTISANDFSNSGFSSGDIVFVKVYGDSFWSNEYEDSNSGKKIFPNLNTSTVNAISFIVP